MLCDECIKALFYEVCDYPGAITILKEIDKMSQPLNQSEIISRTGLTISMTRDLLNILRGAKLISAETKGRAICYSLSEDFRQSFVYVRGDLKR
mgnify:CR=1 FL=1